MHGLPHKRFHHYPTMAAGVVRLETSMTFFQKTLLYKAFCKNLIVGDSVKALIKTANAAFIKKIQLKDKKLKL